jgi:hypothetical protein
MSENFADFLNDNAGVVTGAAGLAVHRNITATNRNLTALRGEIGKLQERFAKEKEKEARESLNRDILFRISQQVETLASENPSPDQYFELIRVSEDLRSLGFTSATFNSLQDKSYLASVSSSIDRALEMCLESLPEETRSLVTAAVAWNSLRSLSTAVVRADEGIASSQGELVEARRGLGVLEKSKPNFFSNKAAVIYSVAGLVLAMFFGLLAAGGTSQTAWLVILALVCGGTALFAFFAGMMNLDIRRSKHFLDTEEANRRVLHAEDQIKRYRTKRSGLVRQLSGLKEIPPETIEYYESEAMDYSERLNQLNDVSDYINQVYQALGITTSKLPHSTVAHQGDAHQFGHDGKCRRCGCTKEAASHFGFSCNL